MPINIYEGDRPICQCHNEADAALIVEAVNRFRMQLSADMGMCRNASGTGYICAEPRFHRGDHSSLGVTWPRVSR